MAIEGSPTEGADLRKAGVFGASSFLILPENLAAGRTDESTCDQDRNVLVARHSILQLLDFL